MDIVFKLAVRKGCEIISVSEIPQNDVRIAVVNRIVERIDVFPRYSEIIGWPVYNRLEIDLRNFLSGQEKTIPGNSCLIRAVWRGGDTPPASYC